MAKTIMSNGRPAGFLEYAVNKTKAFDNNGTFLGEYDATIGFTVDRNNTHYCDGDGTVGLVIESYHNKIKQ